MAITAYRRRLQGQNTYGRDSRNTTIVETWVVEGADNAAVNDRWVAVKNALPQYGDAHDWEFGLYVVGVAFEPIDPSSTTTYIGTITYGIPEAEQQEPSEDAEPTIEVGSTTQTVSTELDVARQPMKVGWFEPVYFLNEETQSTDLKYVYHEQVGTVDVQIPQTFYRLRRREPNSPASKAIDFVGKINSAKFFRFPPRTWLCAGIRGDYQNGAYDVSYEFIYNPETWVSTVSYTDPETGRTPSGVVVADMQPAPVGAVRQYVDASGKVEEIPITAGTPFPGSIRSFRTFQEADFRLLNVEF